MLVYIQIKGVLNHTITFRNDLCNTVEALCWTSYLQFHLDEDNGNPTIGQELVFDTTFSCESTLQDCFWGVKHKARKEGHSPVEVLFKC